MPPFPKLHSDCHISGKPREREEMSADLSAISRQAMDASKSTAPTVAEPVVAPTITAPPPPSTPPSVDWKSHAKSFYNSGWFQYVAIFVSVVALLYILRPPFVLSEIPPNQQTNPAYEPGCSLRAVLIVALASVAFSVIIPVIYRNWAWITSSAKGVADTVRSVTQN